MNKAPPIEEMVADPAAHFSSPAAVVADPDLSVHLKQKILESWKADAQHMSESAGENMTGGERNRLQEVSDAILELKDHTVVRKNL